jgi:hypothetical protein
MKSNQLAVVFIFVFPFLVSIQIHSKQSRIMIAGQQEFTPDRALLQLDSSSLLYTFLHHSRVHMNVTLWERAFQPSHTKDSFLLITSKFNLSDWKLSPHLEFSTSFMLNKNQKIYMDPFVALNWAQQQWKRHFHKRAPTKLHSESNKYSTYLLRTEIGVRFHETFECAWGCVNFEEKISYLNRSPTHKKTGLASLIGANSSFDMELNTFSGLNQGKAELHIECIPFKLTGIHASFDYQGEFDTSFKSHMLTFTMSKEF